MSEHNRPNILWLCTDQQRYDTIGALGNERINTPNIDRLCGEGVCFANAFCQSPVCSPSRASFLTGRYPRTTRCRQNGQQIPSDEILLPKMFADAGYRCGLAGKLHLASCSEQKVESRIEDGYHDFHWSHHPQPDWGEANAYQAWLHRQGRTWDELYDRPPSGSNYWRNGMPTEYHQTHWCADETIRFLQENQGRPWFFSFNCFAPHHPFDPPREFLEKYDPADMPLPKKREGELSNKPTFQQLDSVWAHHSPGEFHSGGMTDDDRREVCAAYYAMCEHIDFEVGRILDALEKSGQAENTVVIFMSDHGEMLGDHGIYFKGPHFYDEALRVPLVMRWPGRYRTGAKADDLVELLDIAPTLLEAADIEPPADRLQGKSLTSLLRGEGGDGEHRDAVFCEYYNSWTHGDAYGTMLRTKKEKIVVYHGTEQGEYYDLEEDPEEFDNRFHDPERSERVCRLIQRCFDASVFTMDPGPTREGAF